MAEETIDSAIALLRSKALEIYGVIKETYATHPQPGSAEQIAKYSLQLANFEGAMVTLQQYKSNIIETTTTKPRAPNPAPAPPPEIPRSQVATEDDLAEKSETFRRSMKHHRTREVDES